MSFSFSFLQRPRLANQIKLTKQSAWMSGVRCVVDMTDLTASGVHFHSVSKKGCLDNVM